MADPYKCTGNITFVFLLIFFFNSIKSIVGLFLSMSTKTGLRLACTTDR